MNSENLAIELKNITQRLFNHCQQKEIKFAEKFGVSVVEFRCLNIIYHATQLNINNIANELNVTSGRVTRLTDQLLSKGLIHRTPGVTDRRQNVIDLSDKGLKLIKVMNKNYTVMQQDVLEGIDDFDQAPMIKMLTTLNKSVKGVLEKM